MLTRRSITAALGGLFGAVGLGKTVQAETAKVTDYRGMSPAEIETNERMWHAENQGFIHSLFHTGEITGATMVDRSTPHTGKADAEVHEALLAESLATIQYNWMEDVRRAAGSPVATFDQSLVTGTPTFVGDVHAALGIMINRQAQMRTINGQETNTIIVSPTAMTILQSATTSNLVRMNEYVMTNHPRRNEKGPRFAAHFRIGTKDIDVLIDEYAADSQPVLIGFIDPVRENRPAAVIRRGLSEVDFAFKDGYAKGWDQIGIETRSLTFI